MAELWGLVIVRIMDDSSIRITDPDITAPLANGENICHKEKITTLYGSMVLIMYKLDFFQHTIRNLSMCIQVVTQVVDKITTIHFIDNKNSWKTHIKEKYLTVFKTELSSIF